MFDYMGAFLLRSGFAHVDNVITKTCSKTMTWLLLSRLQGNKPHRNSPEPSETRELSGTLRNLPEPACGTYTSTHRNPPEPSGTCLQNLHQHTPGTFRNLPPEPIPAHAGTLRNFLERASRTYTSTHRNSPEPSGTFLRNLLLRPAPAHTPLACAVGEKNGGIFPSQIPKPFGFSNGLQHHLQELDQNSSPQFHKLGTLHPTGFFS